MPQAMLAKGGCGELFVGSEEVREDHITACVALFIRSFTAAALLFSMAACWLVGGVRLCNLAGS